MPRRQVFYSFKYADDVARVQRIRNIGMIDDNKPVTSQKWEEVKGGGDEEIKKWIREQMQNKSCVVVLIGENTWMSDYVNYEIEYAWSNNIPIFGIAIHEMRDLDGKKADKPFFNPFDLVQDRASGEPLSKFVTTYKPDAAFQTADKSIQENLEGWVEETIASPPQGKVNAVS